MFAIKGVVQLPSRGASVDGTSGRRLRPVGVTNVSPQLTEDLGSLRQPVEVGSLWVGNLMKGRVGDRVPGLGHLCHCTGYVGQFAAGCVLTNGSQKAGLRLLIAVRCFVKGLSHTVILSGAGLRGPLHIGTSVRPR